MIDPERTPPENRLDLGTLGSEPGQPGLTPTAGRHLAEAAAVCLSSQGHQPGTVLMVRGLIEQAPEIIWPEVTPQMARTYNDLQEATEDGACAVAILLMRTFTRLTVILRSRKGTGIDYWLGAPIAGKTEEPVVFQNTARLEVSGILRGTQQQMAARMRQKRAQVQRSDGTRLPAYTVIVEFSGPHALTERIHESADQPLA